MLAIDHVIFGARQMDAVAHRWWADYGLASYEGGVHPQFGTGNRIVPLGDSYIEIMGIVDEAAAASNPLGQYLLQQIAHGDRWIATCLRTDDITAVASRIGSAAVPGERHTPDGGIVSWTLTGLEIALTQPPLPFFIQWDDASAHPGAVPLEHRCGATGVSLIEIACDQDVLREHLGGDALPIVVTKPGASIDRVVLTTKDGDLEPS